MAKINNKLIYALEDLPDLLDYLIGSKDKNGKTRNFSLQSIVNLINGVNGKNVIQYQFFSELTPDVDYTSPGAMFTNNNETDVNEFTSLIFNKSTLGNYDLTILFDFLAGVDNLFIGVDNPSNPNNFFTFKVTSISNHDDYFIFGVEPYNEMYIGELSNESIYSLYWETKEWISELENINTELGTKLPHGGYNGSGQSLKNDIDAINEDLDDNYYTKPEIDSKISSVYKFKGNVPNYASLPTVGLEIGDVYNAEDTDINWAWTGNVWDNIGGSIDVSGKEDKSNKQNSLVPDGTGQKYSTVDAVNSGNALKLDKGTYTGNAGDLKNDIDNIYQPNVLILSVPPTRSVNTFTYPATQYQALINKTIRTNPAQFITTISVASTADHKRIDLIWFKDDNTLVKEVGVESLTVAERPNIPVGQTGVPVSFINVFGNVVETPTPIINQISVQDSNGVQIFTVPENGFIQFKGVTINGPAKRIEVDPVVGGVIFVSSTGNDSTAQIENRNKPYLTLDAAITAYWTNASIDYIEIISDTSFSISVALDNGSTNRKLDIRSQKTCTVSVTRNGLLGRSNQNLNFYLPNGTFRLAGTASNFFGGSGIGIGNVNIEASTTEYNSFYTNSRMSKFDLKTNVLNLNGTASGICGNTGGAIPSTITAKTINLRGAGTMIVGTFTDTLLDFDLLTHDNTFVINATSGALKINHGSISSVSPYVNTTNITYLRLSSSTVTVNYKTGSTISSNLSIGAGGASGIMVLSGIVSYPNSNQVISSMSSDDKIFLTNANITCKRLVGFRSSKRFTITNSYFNITGTTFIDTELNAADTFTADTVTFKGSNFIIFDTPGGNLYAVTGTAGTNKPSAKIVDGVLNTNGKFDRSKITITESPLNQYYDGIQRQLILVDEKEEIVNKVLDSTKTYFINGNIQLVAGDFILEPAGGLTIAGYGYNTSGFTKNVAGESIIKSAVGNSGDLTLKDMFFNSGAGSVFDLTDINGTHAIEMNDVNFISCSSLGVISGYRQFTGQTIGVYSCSDGLTLSGTWNGFSMAKMHVRAFGITGTLLKKGTSVTFSNRFSLGVNISSNTGYKLLDFDNTMFTKDKTLQLSDCTVEISGVIDASNTASLIPNISPNDPKCKWYNSLGITLTALDFLDFKSPDGNIWRISVSNAGALVLTDI